ncbi:kelch-like protein 10 [Dermacentor variabilis]|uniref:kelch-like protein 10 n=1 Tax=Dermacentor variabilis TaxID=34621 RepID=UPI003F5AE72F
MRCAIEEEPMDADDNAACETGGAVSASFEAGRLFHDRQGGLVPGVVAGLMPGLRDQRKVGEFCDVTFRATDGVEIWAHRFVLAARFSGCYELFTLAKRGMSSEQRRMNECPPPIRAVMTDLDSDMTELLVGFAYHTPPHELIGQHNVAKALGLAEKLKIFRIRDHCLNTLKEDLKPETCIDTYHLTSSLGFEHLAGEAFRYLGRNFDQVWKSSAQFQALTPEEMHTILEDDRLHAPNEVEDAFGAVLKWISADVDERKAWLAKFLPLVRFARCSVTEFEKVVTDPRVQSDRKSLKVLSVIHQTLTRQSMAVGDVAGVDLSPKLWLTPRHPKGILFLFGGWTVCATNMMLTYNSRAAKWSVMGRQDTIVRAYHGVAVVDQCIYFVGGFNGRECYHSVVCLDVPLARWSAKANMAIARCYVSVAVLQGQIYAMGGFDGHTRTNTVERYDVETNRWSMVASMNDVRCSASADVAAGRICIAGGFSGQEVLDTVECYDPSTNVWTRVLTMSSPRSGLQVVAHEDTLYIIGGFNGTARLSSMEQLDVSKARWSRLPSMSHVKSNFAAVVLEGCIYVIGGFTANTTVSQVERYDIATRHWYTAPDIVSNCAASTACIVQDVPNPAAWI